MVTVFLALLKLALARFLATKGLKQIASGERNVITAVVCLVSVYGMYVQVPLMFIFKRKLIKGCNSDMMATVSNSGYIMSLYFLITCDTSFLL